MSDLHDNPMGTDGFEFVEYTAPDPQLLRSLFERLGFPVAARHRSKNVTLHTQGEINFIINAEADSFAQSFARAHGPSACAMAFRVRDAASAYSRALALGAKPGPQSAGPMELNIPCIEGIGGSLIYLVDRYGERSIYDVDFRKVAPPAAPESAGLRLIDHLTHNVGRGRMDVWAGFYEKLFNFREIRYFDIEGKHTGLLSRAMTSPCGKIRIPINESQDDKSQIEEYLREYHGEGIQHIALAADDIYRSVDVLRRQGVGFQDTPDTYYEGVSARVPGSASRSRSCARGASSSTATPRGARGCCCRSSRATSSVRSSSRSSSARATRASARATFERCSNPSSRTRSAAACCSNSRLAEKRTAF